MNSSPLSTTSSGQNTLPSMDKEQELSTIATAYGLPVAVVKGVRTVIAAIASGHFTRKTSPPFHWHYRTTEQLEPFALSGYSHELHEGLIEDIAECENWCAQYKMGHAVLDKLSQEGRVPLKNAHSHLSYVIDLLNSLYGCEQAKKPEPMGKRRTTAKENHLFMTLARETTTRLGQHLDFCTTLISSLEHCIGALIDGDIPDQPLCYELIDKYGQSSRRNHASCHSEHDLASPPFSLEVQKIRAKEHSVASKELFAEFYISSLRSPPSSFFWRCSELAAKFIYVTNRKFGIHLLLNKEICRQLDVFFHQAGVNHVLDVFSGTGLFQAAMKSIDSPVRITSLDNFSESPACRPITGNSRSFFPAHDDTGVLFVEDSFTFLCVNRHLVQKDACLLLAFPGPQPGCLRALQNLLKLWASGGLVILLSEAVDEELLYGDTFTHGGYQKIDVHNFKLPSALTQSIPHVPPRLFYVKHTNKSLRNVND